MLSCMFINNLFNSEKITEQSTFFQKLTRALPK